MRRSMENGRQIRLRSRLQMTTATTKAETTKAGPGRATAGPARVTACNGPTEFRASLPWPATTRSQHALSHSEFSLAFSFLRSLPLWCSPFSLSFAQPLQLLTDFKSQPRQLSRLHTLSFALVQLLSFTAPFQCASIPSHHSSSSQLAQRLLI